jgi:hypothetical protein
MKRLKMKITISVVIYLMFLLKLRLFFNANITVNKLSTRHVHTLVPEDTHVHTLVPEDTHVHTLVPDDTYWATYYQRLIHITEIVHVEPIFSFTLFIIARDL